MTTLTNTDYINKFDDKLKIYHTNFFSVINGAGGLLSEANTITTPSSLNIPDAGGATSTYSTDQFATFIRKIVNFNIKNYSEQTLTDTDLCFVKKSSGGSSTSNDANRDHIIKTLKVINVFVDILEAYKYCIDKADDATFDSGYKQNNFIDRIEIVTDKTRFYTSGVMTPSGDDRNVGYIRTVSKDGIEKKVLFLSIQSFKTGMETPNNLYNYDDLFTTSGTSDLAANTNILTNSAVATISPSVDSYKYQRYESTDDTATITTTGLTLDNRNKNLIKLLIRTLFGLDITFRKQSVYALYYYYKFVQLYSAFIIHVSNVMYNDVKSGASGDTISPFTIETYNMTTNRKTHGLSAIEKASKNVGSAVAVSYAISHNGTAPTTPASIAPDTASGPSITIAVTTAGSGYSTSSIPTVNISNDVVGATRPTAVANMGYKIERINLGYTVGTTPGTNYVNGKTSVSVTPVSGIALRNATFTVTVNQGGDITGVTVPDGGVYESATPPTIQFIGTGSGSGNGAGSGRTATAVMASTRSVGTISVTGGSGYSLLPTISFDPDVGQTKAVATASIAPGSYALTDSSQGSITRGKGYLQNPTIVLNPAMRETAKATIVPMVYAATTITNDNNITRLENVISEINDTVNLLLDELATYDSSTTQRISTYTTDNGSEKTVVYPSSDITFSNMVTINVKKPTIYNKLVVFNELFDIIKDYYIYDTKNKYSYDIIKVENTAANDFKFTINAVFTEAEQLLTTNARLFKNSGNIILPTKPSLESPADISYDGDFLELRMKDTNSYKTSYVTTRDDISKLETDINFKSSKVTHQKNLYESQNNKKIFLERQILAYNIILTIIVLILVGINVVKVDKEVVKTVSLSCFGAIILLFVIYFISNLTYVESFADYGSGRPLYVLSYTSRQTDASDTAYNNKKKNKLNDVITELNSKFIGYFEKLIITLPATDNYQFYKEISEIITNDRDNKEFTNNSLDYSKNQNDNNINSIKYELENNKLYINTLLISAIIFVGLYNMYINYIKDDKYLTLFVFICIIIFIIILSYYYITANRRVKTVFKSIYWGPEFSKRF